jgi:hypothetical protein
MFNALRTIDYHATVAVYRCEIVHDVTRLRGAGTVGAGSAQPEQPRIMLFSTNMHA